jgi:hypothetical protein
VCACEDGYVDIDVVVYFDVCLAGRRSQGASDVLNDSAFEHDGEGKEESVERGAVEAFAEIRASCYSEQRVFGLVDRQSRHGLAPCFRAESSSEDHGIVIKVA